MDEHNFHVVFRRLAQEYPGYHSKDIFTYLHNLHHGLPHGAYSRRIKVLDWQQVDEFDNKKGCALRLQKCGCESAFAPSFMDPLSAWNATQNNPSALFFLKQANATKGTGMCVVTRDQLRTCRMNHEQVLQQAVQDLMLLDGRKFVIRYYILIHNRRVFLHRRAAVIIHGVAYDRSSTDYKVQIQHDFDTPGSTTRLMSLHSLAQGGQWHNAIRENFVQIMPALQRLIDTTSADSYTLIGGDALIESSGRAKFIEFNFFPAMFANSLEFNTQVSQPVLRDMIALILLGDERGELEELHSRSHTAELERMPPQAVMWHYPTGAHRQTAFSAGPPLPTAVAVC